MSRRTHIRFVVNPVSGVGKQGIVPGIIKQQLDQFKYDDDIVYTEYAGHAKEIARAAVAERVDIVCAVGGDGLVNEVASALVNSDTALSVVPTGSGNGLARHLKVPVNLTRAVQRINRGQLMKIDTATLDDIFFVGTAGMGLDAKVAHQFEREGRRGFLSYIKIVIKEFLLHKPATYTIEIDGQMVRQEAIVLTVANSSEWGNGAQIAPKASLQDGVLDLCLIKPFPVLAAPVIAARLFLGTIDRSKYFISYQGRVFRLGNTEGMGHVDGEPVILGDHVSVKVGSASLWVWS